eukprot:5036987-Amphidinium_carterae.1
MTWRLVVGTLFLTLSSLRSFIESNDVWSQASSVNTDESATQSEFGNPEDESSEREAPEAEPWAWTQYRHSTKVLHQCWLWVVRTIAWNLLPFNRNGVVGWLVHKVGQAAFGGKWIYVQVILGVITVVFVLYIFGSLLGVIAFGLEWAIIRPIVAVWRVVNMLIWAQPPPQLSQLDFRGPTGAREADNDFYKRLRGRDAKGRPHHCIAFVQNQAVRLSRGSTAGPPPKSHGMDYAYLQVQGSSGRTARKTLEDHEGRHVIHLCRHQPCVTGGDYAAHTTCYSCVEEDSIHELADASALPVWWRSSGVWRTAAEHCWQVVRRVPVLARMFWHCCRCCCRRRQESIPPVESESETDHEEEMCLAHCVLLGGQECGRALADKPCKNRVVDDATPLLEEDFETSQLREEQHLRGQVKLCRHHWLVYRSTRHTQKCSRLACWRLGAEVANGVRVCSEHASLACGLSMPALGPQRTQNLLNLSSGDRNVLASAPATESQAAVQTMNPRSPQIAATRESAPQQPVGTRVESAMDSRTDPLHVSEAREHLRALTKMARPPVWMPGGEA